MTKIIIIVIVINAGGDRNGRTAPASGRVVGGGGDGRRRVFREHPVVANGRRAADVLVHASAASAPAYRLPPRRVVVAGVVVLWQRGRALRGTLVRRRRGIGRLLGSRDTVGLRLLRSVEGVQLSVDPSAGSANGRVKCRTVPRVGTRSQTTGDGHF